MAWLIAIGAIIGVLLLAFGVWVYLTYRALQIVTKYSQK